eukprot:364630-Chlamydomonas_euryale.AAC.9
MYDGPCWQHMQKGWGGVGWAPSSGKVLRQSLTVCNETVLSLSVVCGRPGAQPLDAGHISTW